MKQELFNQSLEACVKNRVNVWIRGSWTDVMDALEQAGDERFVIYHLRDDNAHYGQTVIHMFANRGTGKPCLVIDSLTRPLLGSHPIDAVTRDKFYFLSL